MGFGKFGQISFTSQTKADEFVEYLEMGSCVGLSAVMRPCFFPPRADCSFCLSDDMEWFKVEGEGSLVSFTKVNYGPTGFESDVPYILALVDYNGTKVFGRFKRMSPRKRSRWGWR